MLPPRSPEKKKFTPAMLIKFLKRKKLSLKDVSNKLSDSDDFEKLAKDITMFVHRS